jgi:CubicO group peptidase (beta-lactamase class C family)
LGAARQSGRELVIQVSLDEHIGDFVPGIEGADKIAIRDLLTERSGLPDINAFPNYGDILHHHQTRPA